jgi:two-component system, sensor histidine kinase and response regulator
MVRKITRKILDYIFAENDNFSFENRMFLSSIAFAIIICLISFIIVCFVEDLPLLVSLFSLGVGSTLLIIYYFVRFKRIIKPFVALFIAISFIGFAASWFLVGGINGSNIMLGFVVLILALIIVSEKNRKYVIISFILVLLIIYIVQYYKPDFVTDFTSESDRWMDSITTAIYSSFCIFLIINFLLKQYNIERRRAEESEKRLIQLNADKDRFISILSHDLKSPFNSLLGFTELLSEDIRDLETEDIESIVLELNKSARNTYNLLEDLLVWAMAQQGNIPFNPQNIKLKSVYEDAIDVLRPNALAKGITINCMIEDGIYVFADIDMLKTILRNLVSNSIKFTHKNGQINICAMENPENVTITVQDNGIGISPDNLTRLFELSGVITTPGTEDEKGTGLGLLLCKEFAERHGGRIWAESESDKGCEFRFIMPKKVIVKI